VINAVAALSNHVMMAATMQTYEILS
jgi:hypothetical protein